MSKPKEWWIDPDYDGYFDDTDENLIAGGFVKAIEMDAYIDLKQKYEELLSYLPKVPTQPYEKKMAKRILELEDQCEKFAREIEHLIEQKILDQSSAYQTWKKSNEST